MLTRILLVTLLTCPIVSFGENLTTTQLPTYTISTTIRTLAPVVFETLDGVDRSIDENSTKNEAEIVEFDDEQQMELDLTVLDGNSDSSFGNDTKIETNAIIDEIPQIIMPDSSEDVEPTTIAILHEAVYVEEKETTTTMSGNVFKADGVVLPTNDDVFINEKPQKNATKPDSMESPLTFWDHSSLFVSRFTYDNPKISIFILVVIFCLLIFLLVLIVLEWCKRRAHYYCPRAEFSSAADDLYNTSSCSHRYTKVTLPDNQEVTMQLMSADNSVDLV